MKTGNASLMNYERAIF